MNGWWIALGVVLFLSALLLWPTEWRFSYKESFSAEVRWLFFRYSFTDRPQKKPKKTKSPAANVTKKKPSLHAKLNEFEELVGAKTLPEALSRITALLKDLAARTSRLLTHSTLSRLDLSVDVGGADAADAALAYGTVCAAVYPLIAWGTGLFRRVKKQTVHIACCFEKTGVTAAGILWVRVTPLTLLAAAIGWVFTYITMQNQSNHKEEASL